jgi:hypothetical protein
MVGRARAEYIALGRRFGRREELPMFDSICSDTIGILTTARTRAAALALTVVALAGCGVETTDSPDGDRAEAAEELTALQLSSCSLGTDTTFLPAVRAGFVRFTGASAADVTTMKLGPSREVFTIPVAALAAYRPGANPIALFVDTHDTMTPGTIRGVKKGVLHVGANAPHTATELDQSDFETDLVSSSMTVTHLTACNYFSIEIPELLAELVGFQTSAGLMIIPAHVFVPASAPDLTHAFPSTPMKAADALKALQALARAEDCPGSCTGGL